MAEESKRTALIMTAASTFVAIAVTGLVGWATGVWSQGSEAIQRDQIEAIAKEVVADELETDSGMTQAQALVAINEALIRIETTVTVNREDIRDIRTAVQALAE
jgi:hypothetical protein